MNRFAVLLTVGFALANPVLAADSVVLGRGVSNTFFDRIECSPDSICMDSLYLWELDVKQTLVGPPVKGRVRALFASHGAATPEFVRDVELFVLSPSEGVKGGDSKFPAFGIIALSPRYEGDQYCLPMDPRSVGLDVDSTKAKFGLFCFPRKSILKQ
jgi:hypothetical protein